MFPCASVSCGCVRLDLRLLPLPGCFSWRRVQRIVAHPSIAQKLSLASTRVSHSLNTLCSLTLQLFVDAHTRAASTRRRGPLQSPSPPQRPDSSPRCCSARTGAGRCPRINFIIVWNAHFNALIECFHAHVAVLSLSSRRPSAPRVSASPAVRRCSLYQRRASVS